MTQIYPALVCAFDYQYNIGKQTRRMTLGNATK
jgi:hypothetical protein